MKKYIVVGGDIMSKTDGDRHYVNARKLCNLYQINPNDCILIEERSYYGLVKYKLLPEGLPVLRPKYDGKYNLTNKEKE